MKKEIRAVPCGGWPLEVYRFENITQSFPNHFHDYCVIGLVEAGTRRLTCKNSEFLIRRGDVVLFNPNDSHGCAQESEEPFCYRGISMPTGAMQSILSEITGIAEPLGFARNVLSEDVLAANLRTLHSALYSGVDNLEREEMLLTLMSMLVEHCGQPLRTGPPPREDAVEAVCRFIQEHYAEPISLDQLCRCGAWSKSTLLRAFTRAKGVTPYRYLQSFRIGRAQELLESGISSVEAAMQTGFADQSHFTSFFQMYIGLPPGVYGRIYSQTSNGQYLTAYHSRKKGRKDEY